MHQEREKRASMATFMTIGYEDHARRNATAQGLRDA
jgi:hypothetical protein